jgi:hypothetical protein
MVVLQSMVVLLLVAAHAAAVVSTHAVLPELRWNPLSQLLTVQAPDVHAVVVEWMIVVLQLTVVLLLVAPHWVLLFAVQLIASEFVM